MSTLASSRPPSRLIRPRRAVFEAVTDGPAHMSAGGIYDAIRQRGERIAPASVYNAVHYLVATGLIAEVRRPDGTLSYDRSTIPHDHVRRRVCDRNADVWPRPEASLRREAYDEVAPQTGYAVERHRVEFAGVCPACRDLGHQLLVRAGVRFESCPPSREESFPRESISRPSRRSLERVLAGRVHA